MNILQILPELNVGGVETGTVDLAKYLVDHGHQSIVVSNGGGLVEELEQAGTKHYHLPVHKKSLWTILKSIRGIHQIIIKENVDIVHARSRVPAWVAFFATRRTNAAFITTCHGHYARHFFSRAMGWAKLIIVPSEVIGRHMIESFGVLSENIRYIPRGVDLTKFQFPPNLEKPEPQSSDGKGAPEDKEPSDYVIAMIGRITPLKGHAYFLKAMAQVLRVMPRVKIWIIGDSPPKKESYKEELEVLVRHLGLGSHVEFLGNRKDIAQLLAQTHVLVLSTITQEAFGRVILEAQAAGVPVVATKVGGVIEIIDDEETGLLVLPKDIHAMAEAVLRLLKDKKLVHRLTSAAGKKLKEKFTVERMAASTLKVYEELLNSLNILVIKISSVGDVVLVTASLKAMHKKFPHAKIFCLVGQESRKILQRSPYLDGLIIRDFKDKDKGMPGVLRTAKILRRYNFDKVIDFQNNYRSHLLAFLSFPRESYGYDHGKGGFLLSNRIKGQWKEIGPVEHQFKILEMLDIEFSKDYRLELWPSLEDQVYAEELLDSEWLGNAKNIVGINMTASGRWPTKNWPLEYIAALCDILSTKNIRVMITGMEKDKALARQLLTLTKAKPAIFAGKTDIPQLAVLIKRCKVFITPDSAPMHVAAAVGTPLIAFFGPTDPLRHTPPAKRCIILKKDLKCSPCYGTQCRIKTHACMREITPQEVALKIEELMSDGAL